MITNRGLFIAFSSIVVMVVIISLLMVMRGEKHKTKIRKESSVSFTIPYSRAIRYDLNEYKDFMKVSQQELLLMAKEIRNKQITHLPNVVIVSQLLVGGANRDKVYNLDLLTSVQMNLLNPAVSEYHFLQIDNSNDADIMSLMFSHQKVKIHHIGDLITQEIFLKYCNEHLSDDRIVVYLNQPDVYFDNTLIHVSKLQYGEYVKIQKRISVQKPYDCEKGQGLIPDGIIFKTNSKQPFEIEMDEESNDKPIIPLVSKLFNVHRCELSEMVYGWFLHEPSNLVYYADKEAEFKEQERIKKEKEEQVKKEQEQIKREKEEQVRKIKEEKEKKEQERIKKEKEEKEMKLKEENEKKLKEENERKLKEEKLSTLNSSNNSSSSTTNEKTTSNNSTSIDIPKIIPPLASNTNNEKND